MPRKTKDETIENVKNKSTNKKATAKKVVAEKDVNSKSSKKTTPNTKATVKEEISKKTVVKEKSSKKETSKRTTVKKEATKTPKKVNNKKTSTQKSTTKKRTSKKTSQIKKNKPVEYYDLPNYYEQTLVKILAQTPTVLFVYWNISDTDTQKLLKQYGEKFFYETNPVLLIINKTKNYQFEVEINDYANSWYLNIPECDCEYEVILIRKNKNQTVSITSSNQIEMPNDHILFEKLGKTVFFKNTKTEDLQEKNISSFSLMHNLGKIYNIYDFYKQIYKNELNGNELDEKLPSS